MLAAVLWPLAIRAEPLFVETFGNTGLGASDTGLFQFYGDNRSAFGASGYSEHEGSEPVPAGTIGIRRLSASLRSDNALDGVQGASGGYVLRFAAENAGSEVVSQWYQFNQIPLIGTVGDLLELDFLFRGSTAPAGLDEPNDFFDLSVSWDGDVFSSVSMDFSDGYNSGLTKWKSVTSSGLLIETESLWLRFTANPGSLGEFPELFFDDLKLSVTASAVPEPAAFAWWGGLGILGLVLSLRRGRPRLG